MPAIGLVPVYNLSLSDPIFDSLKIDYPDFKTWWKKISREGRKAWALDKPDKKLEAFLILFLLHFELKNYITLPKLQEARIMLRAPQSVMEISDGRYRQILKMGGLDERFTFH